MDRPFRYSVDVLWFDVNLEPSAVVYSVAKFVEVDLKTDDPTFYDIKAAVARSLRLEPHTNIAIVGWTVIRGTLS